MSGNMDNDTVTNGGIGTDSNEVDISCTLGASVGNPGISENFSDHSRITTIEYT
jgi:hypothetical protein